MYLTRIAGIETESIGTLRTVSVRMYLTRIAGIETLTRKTFAYVSYDVSYPHSGN